MPIQSPAPDLFSISNQETACRLICLIGRGKSDIQIPSAPLYFEEILSSRQCAMKNFHTGALSNIIDGTASFA